MLVSDYSQLRDPAKMGVIGVAVLGTMLCSVLSATIKVKEEHRTAFFSEDVHFLVPSLTGTEVLFRPRAEPLLEVVLMRDGMVVSPRAQLNAHLSHLILKDVGEEDEGLYVIRDANAPAEARHINLVVRDCSTETTVKYWETYHIQLQDPAGLITGPVTVEFRPAQLSANQSTEPPPVLLLNQSHVPAEEYRGRLSASDKRVTLHTVTGADEGSYTVLDQDGKVRKRTCLNVKEHQNFVQLQYDGTLKINLFLDHRRASLVYWADSDLRYRVILERGELADPLDPTLDGRLSVEGSLVYLEGVRAADMGLFRVTDLQGFRVSDTYLVVKAYKLPMLNLAILCLVSFLALLLLVCLLSCIVKVRRRAEKAKKLTLIAQQAGKGEGDAFRQVVHDAYTRFAKDSTVQSTWDDNTDNTEVEIKGLEVSRAGRYHALTSDKNFLEMSDSGVEFNCAALPLDSDTDGTQTCASHKPLLGSAHSDSLVHLPAVTEDGTIANHTPDATPGTEGAAPLDPSGGADAMAT